MLAAAARPVDRGDRRGRRGAGPGHRGRLRQVRRGRRRCLRVVTAGMGTPINEPADRSRAPPDDRAAVRAVARASSLFLRDACGCRTVGGGATWAAGGVAAGADPEHAVAVPLLFRRGRYHHVDPDTRARPIDATVAATFAAEATEVQAPLPPTARMRHRCGPGSAAVPGRTGSAARRRLRGGAGPGRAAGHRRGARPAGPAGRGERPGRLRSH